MSRSWWCVTIQFWIAIEERTNLIAKEVKYVNTKCCSSVLEYWYWLEIKFVSTKQILVLQSYLLKNLLFKGELDCIGDRVSLHIWKLGNSISAIRKKFAQILNKPISLKTKRHKLLSIKIGSELK